MVYTRVPIVGGNFKANGTLEFIKKHVATLSGAEYPENIEIVVAPTALHAQYVQEHIDPRIQVAVQNNYIKAPGAWTGELPVELIKDLGIQWVIVGHSERRHIINESDDFTAQKALRCLEQGMKIMYCTGETLAEREAGETLAVNIRQLEALKNVIGDKCELWDNVVIAYEPVWSIGTGVTASPEQAQEVHAALRAWIAEKVCPDLAEKIRIMYGGSANAKNAAKLSECKDIDGFLVGGASLKPEFIDIVRILRETKSKL